MDEARHAETPASIDLRLVESVNDPLRQRTEKLATATTLLDHKRYDAKWLAGTYCATWRGALEIRSIKCTLGMDIQRAKSLEMVRTELWSCLLLHNLIRESMLSAAIGTGCDAA